MRIADNPLLAPRHWPAIVEGALVLAAASVATRTLPFRHYIQAGSLRIRRAHGLNGRVTGRIVDALANRLPLKAVCLQRGLALQWMLRRRGVDAILHYGVRLPGSDEELAAHVWVSVDGKVVIGAPQHEHYTEVARYPSAE